MYKYKRGIGNIDNAKILEYSLTDNKNTCFSMTANLENRRPYNGMYIKNGKILLLNLLEKLIVKDREYNLSQLTTSTHIQSCDEYILSINLDKNMLEYKVGNVMYIKRIHLYEGILCIEYDIENRENTNVTFRVSPLITYRDLYEMKRVNVLKFNQRNDKNGVFINLSILSNENIIAKSQEMVWTREPEYINNIKHEYVDEYCVKDIYSEDAFVPGNFEIVLKEKEKKKVYLYFSDTEFDLERINSARVLSALENRNRIAEKNIEEEFVELRELAIQMENMEIKDNLVSSLPYNLEYKNILNEEMLNVIETKKFNSYLIQLTDIVRAIGGQYLVFNKLIKANCVLITVRRYIKVIEDAKLIDISSLKLFAKLKLWYVESVNMLMQKQKDLDLFFGFVKEIIYSIINSHQKDRILNDIETVSLMYNAIKIYESMLKERELDDVVTNEFKQELKEKIENEFWIEEKRVLKRCLDERESFANIEMLYAFSLSYPCISSELSIKVLDTIFKELYTPYGLRIVPKTYVDSKGAIYPKYMSYFVKANLRQNGFTRASQKIAYNLVKDLYQEMDKYVNGGIKKVYNEKGINIDSVSYDLLTNAEIIRLYDMLT